MADEITLTIDGVEVKTAPGTNVLQAAMDAGIYVPYLCYYPDMKAFGACRMCVVEIEGGPPGSQASCTVPAADGMVTASMKYIAVAASAAEPPAVNTSRPASTALGSSAVTPP